MKSILEETQQKIDEIKHELDVLASKLDEERKESNQEEAVGTVELLDKQQYLEEQLLALEEAAFKLSKSTKNSKVIDIGVEATISINGSPRQMTFVPPIQADPTKGLISAESPIGQALLGKSAGKEVEISTPAGMRKFSVIKVGTKSRAK